MDSDAQADLDLTLLRQMLSGSLPEAMDAEPEVDSWWRAAGRVNSPYRLAPFERERGAPVPRVVQGLPASRTDVTVFGLDAAGRSVVEYAYAPEGVLEESTRGLHSDDRRTYLTYNGKGVPQFASIERWDRQRHLSVISASVFEPFWSSQAFQWVDDRIVQIAEVSFDVKGDPRTTHIDIDYADDGKAVSLSTDGVVIWRQRRGSTWRELASEAEAALGEAIASTLSARSWTPADLVLLVHADSGTWTDQTLFAAAVPTPAERAAPYESWLPAEWKKLELHVAARDRTLNALSQLDSFGEPKAGEAEAMLRVAARRARLGIDKPPLIVVTSPDRDDLSHSIDLAGRL